MPILLIDGVTYEVWTPSNEDEFEQIVKEHAKDIFGEESIYLDIKHKLKSKSGIGSIPDGYVIIFGDKPHWHVVEVELSSHPLYEHIVPQVSKFINGIKNPSTQKEIVDVLYREINGDEFLKLHLTKGIGTTEIYKFLSDLLSKLPVVTIIIEKHTEQLDEAISALAHPQIKIVEFQTFTREGVGLNVHAHLFEPLYKPALPEEQGPPSTEWSEDELRSYLEHCHKCRPLTFNYYKFLANSSEKVTRAELINSLGKLMGKPIASDSLPGVLAGITMTITKKLGKERLDQVSEDSQEFSIRENYRDAIQEFTRR